MNYKFQFRLKALLAALVVVCIALGGWHLYFVYFGPFVNRSFNPRCEQRHIILGVPIQVEVDLVEYMA